jgi:hypothetical protein
MEENGIPKFTCFECGEHQLVVTHLWDIEAGMDSERWREWGPLKDDHHWEFEFKEKVEPNEENDENEDEEEVQTGTVGEFLEDDSDSEPEDYEIIEPETSRDSDEYFLNCGNCDHEVEFGWSEPDRRGLIMPVEFSDFNPLDSWADPKYLDAWKQRGWLKAGHTQP